MPTSQFGSSLHLITLSAARSRRPPPIIFLVVIVVVVVLGGGHIWLYSGVAMLTPGCVLRNPTCCQRSNPSHLVQGQCPPQLYYRITPGSFFFFNYYFNWGSEMNFYISQ